MIRRRVAIGSPRIEMTPLIDVIFLLLVVFMASLFHMVRAYVLPVDLPSVATGDTLAARDVLVVTVDRDGDLSLGGRALDGAELAATVADLRRGTPDLTVLVHADTDARHGDVVGLYDLLRSAGQSRVHVVAVPDGSGHR